MWVVAEPAATEPTLEALGEAVELARPGAAGVIAVGSGGDARDTLALWPAAARAASSGSGRPATRRPPRSACAVGTWLGAPDGGRPPIVLLPHTRHGLGVAAHLTVRLDAALAPDAVGVRREADGGLEVTRPAYGDRLYATVRVTAGAAAVVTLRPGALGVGPAGPASAVAIEEWPATTDGAPPAPRLRREMAADPRTVDLRDAERIVAGGRGVGADGFRRLEVLADLLGAAVGGSRVAVDLGWIPWERQIGQSGRAVAPELYLAFGISGASQHMAGIERARTVVAVNADRAAPLLARAQLAACADWQPRRGGADRALESAAGAMTAPVRRPARPMGSGR